MKPSLKELRQQITTTELLALPDTPNHPRTLTRWVRAGLLPAGTLGVVPSGAGRTMYWPRWVALHAAFLRWVLSEKNITCTDLAKALGTDWEGMRRDYAENPVEAAARMRERSGTAAASQHGRIIEGWFAAERADGTLVPGSIFPHVADVTPYCGDAKVRRVTITKSQHARQAVP